MPSKQASPTESKSKTDLPKEPAVVTYATFEEDEEEIGDGDVEINLEDYLRLTHGGIKVTRKNKIVCTSAFVVLIILIGLYVGALAAYHQKYDRISLTHYKGPSDIIYVLMFSDFVASLVGIWTCVRKTGPKPMICTCIWLLLSSLINLCVTISLTFETKEFREIKKKDCPAGKPNTEQCAVHTRIQILLWCSLLSFVPKIVAIFLCRVNFPSVFNWMMGKEVYVDERLMPKSRKSRSAIMFHSVAAGYFDPPDIARIAARGSLKNATVIGGSGSSRAIFVTKGENVGGSGTSVTNLTKRREGDEVKSKRKSTYVSL